jgi:hypothetical protein
VQFTGRIYTDVAEALLRSSDMPKSLASRAATMLLCGHFMRRALQLAFPRFALP